jgi:hypothetical protein
MWADGPLLAGGAVPYLVRPWAACAFQALHLTLARLRWSVASGRRVCRS